MDGAANARPVNLDDEHLPFDVERKTPSVANLTKPVGVYTSRDVLDSKPLAIQIPVGGEGHDRTIPPAMPLGVPDVAIN